MSKYFESQECCLDRARRCHFNSSFQLGFSVNAIQYIHQQSCVVPLWPPLLPFQVKDHTGVFPTLLNKYAVQSVQSLGGSSSIRTIVTKQRHLIAADSVWFRIIISTLISFDWISNSKQIWMTKKRLNDKNKRETLKEFGFFVQAFVYITLHYFRWLFLFILEHISSSVFVCVSFFLSISKAHAATNTKRNANTTIERIINSIWTWRASHLNSMKSKLYALNIDEWTVSCVCVCVLFFFAYAYRHNWHHQIVCHTHIIYVNFFSRFYPMITLLKWFFFVHILVKWFIAMWMQW